jgi:hypothetical protein
VPDDAHAHSIAAARATAGPTNPCLKLRYA